MIDAHFHLDEEIYDYVLNKDFIGILNVQNIKQYSKANELRILNHNIYLSCGIHPWDVETINIESMINIYKECDVIGEIGLDHVWCDCDKQLQIEVFEKQLQIALKLNKSVIIHMMGYEKVVLELLKQYPNQYLIHWVKPMDLLEEFIEIGCYFSVAFDYNEEVIKKIPINRLLVESDGLESLKWLGLDTKAYYQLDKLRLQTISKIKNIDQSEMLQQIYLNLKRFIKE